MIRKRPLQKADTRRQNNQRGRKNLMKDLARTRRKQGTKKLELGGEVKEDQ